MPARHGHRASLSRVACALLVAGVIATACGKIGYDPNLDAASGLARDAESERQDGSVSMPDAMILDVGDVTNDDAVDTGVGLDSSSDAPPDARDGDDASDATDATLRDAAGACPTSIALTNPNSTPLHGGNGGNPGTDSCPAGQAIIGFAGMTGTDNLINMIATLCGRLTPVPAPTSCQIVPTIGATLAMHGDPLAPGTRWTMKCPPGQMVAGIRGRSGASLDHLAIECADVSVTSSGGTYVVSVGAPMAQPGQGGPGGTPFEDVCPRGDVGSGINYRSGALIDAFAIFCSDVIPLP